jgi:GTP-binding protein
MQKSSILAKNRDAKIYTISSAAHQGLEELLRALKAAIETEKAKTVEEVDVLDENSEEELPVIQLDESATKDTWTVTKDENDVYHVTGEKIEKFARRTDYDNYESLNRLRDIMKKYGIRAELTSQGAGPESIVEIAGHEFTLVEDW